MTYTRLCPRCGVRAIATVTECWKCGLDHDEHPPVPRKDYSDDWDPDPAPAVTDGGVEDLPWTERYSSVERHRQQYPAPADWVVNIVEADGVAWMRYSGIGNGLTTDNEVHDALDNELGDIEDNRAESARLTSDPVKIGDSAEETVVENELRIDGETVFRREEVDFDDLMAAVAEALALYSNGGEWQDVNPEGGRAPKDVREQREEELRQEELERTKEQHVALDEFGGDAGV